MATARHLEPTPTGGSSRSHFSSRNPYRDDSVHDSSPLSRNPYWPSMDTTAASKNRSSSLPTIPRRKPVPVSRGDLYTRSSHLAHDPDSHTTTGSNTPPEDLCSDSPEPLLPLFPPNLPARPGVTPIQSQYLDRPPLPPRPWTLDEIRPPLAREDCMSWEPSPPALPPRPPLQEERFFAFRRRMSQLSSSQHWNVESGAGIDGIGEEEIVQFPPRRLLTADNVPVNSVGYTRHSEKVVAYLIPLPAPMHKGQTMKVPQRYMIYTPPAPHLLKPPQGQKEAKRHKCKRLAQEEVKKAKTFHGKTWSLRGLHSKTLRGVDRAVAAVKSADITFLNRIPRKQVTELVLVHPASVLENESPEDVHREFVAQLSRTKRRAAKHSVVSTALFAPAVAIDTFAVVIWPFGGLAEIDGAWMYASVSGYLTARSVSKRLDQTPVTTSGVREQLRLARQLRGEDSVTDMSSLSHSALSNLEDVHRSSPQPPPPPPQRRQVRFQEELDDEDEKLEARKKAAAAKAKNKDPVKVRLVPEEAMDTMSRYFQEICHKRNPRAFPSIGVPPTKTDVLASIGWTPERRMRGPGQDQSEGVWEDENWQSRQVKEDMDRVMMKAAKSWDKWCQSYAKYPERAMKEKGHSIASSMMKKLNLKKKGPTIKI